MILLNDETPADVMREIATNVKSRRLEMNMSQESLAEKAGMKLPTYRKFEQTGKISLESLLLIAFALNCLDEFSSLFSRRQYESIADIINEEAKTNRKRASKKKNT